MVKDQRMENILQPLYYRRADTEPVDALKRIYPFSAVTVDNMYDYECVFYALSVDGFVQAFPHIVKWISNPVLDDQGYPMGLASNLMSAVSFGLLNANYCNRIIIPASKFFSKVQLTEMHMSLNIILGLEVIDLDDRNSLKAIVKFLT